MSGLVSSTSPNRCTAIIVDVKQGSMSILWSWYNSDLSCEWRRRRLHETKIELFFPKVDYARFFFSGRSVGASNSSFCVFCACQTRG